jgi:predicted DCC family thiol-disulfide oxidoreductase YuxK
MDNRSIVIFDGVCNFCNGAVQFIIKRDPKGLFAFTPMQSRAARDLLLKYHLPATGFDTILLIKNEVCYIRSDAVLEIAKDLTGLRHLSRALIILPAPIRDYLYKLFARNRYRLFGKRKSCMVPGAEVRHRFIE